MTLSKGEFLPRKSSLIQLSPFIDENDIMRVDDRIKYSLLSYEEKHSAILSAQSQLTKLIVDVSQERTLHGRFNKR